MSYRIVVAGCARTSATDATTHPSVNSRAQGRFRFDGNKEVLTKRDDQMASTRARRRYSASAKSRVSPGLQGRYQVSRNAARPGLDWSLDRAPPVLCSNSGDLLERRWNNLGRNMPS